MSTIYLARLEFGSYLLQALGQTEEEATEAIRKEWETAKSQNNYLTQGWLFEDFASYHGLWVAPMTLGKAEYH